MTESERNEKFQREWELRKKISDENAKRNQEIFNFVKGGFDAYINFGKEIDLISKQYLIRYFGGIQNKINELKDPKNICDFLMAEQGKCVAKVIEYNIRKEGLLGADYQTAIDKIIVPFYTQYKSVLEFEKIHSSIRQSAPNEIINNSDIQKQKTLENQLQTEDVKTNQSNVLDQETAEKIALRISNAAKKAGLPPIIIQKNTLKISDVESEVSSDKGNTIKQIPIEEKGVPIIDEIVPKLPDGFSQIECRATKEEILDFFMSLAKEKNDSLNKCYMKESDVEEFVKKNFAIFKCTPIPKYFPINLTKKQKGRLRCFVAEFYIEFGSKTVIETRNYALLLMHNFEIFKNDNLKSLIN